MAHPMNVTGELAMAGILFSSWYILVIYYPLEKGLHNELENHNF